MSGVVEAHASPRHDGRVIRARSRTASSTRLRASACAGRSRRALLLTLLFAAQLLLVPAHVAFAHHDHSLPGAGGDGSHGVGHAHHGTEVAVAADARHDDHGPHGGHPHAGHRHAGHAHGEHAHADHARPAAHDCSHGHPLGDGESHEHAPGSVHLHADHGARDEHDHDDHSERDHLPPMLLPGAAGSAAAASLGTPTVPATECDAELEASDTERRPDTVRDDGVRPPETLAARVHGARGPPRG